MYVDFNTLKRLEKDFFFYSRIDCVQTFQTTFNTSICCIDVHRSVRSGYVAQAVGMI